MLSLAEYNPESLKANAPEIFQLAGAAGSVNQARARLTRYAHRMEFETFDDHDSFARGSVIRVRDCAMALTRMLSRRSDDHAQFSLAKAPRDIARGNDRPDLTPAFYADVLHLLLGLQGEGPGSPLVDLHLIPTYLSGRDAAIARSAQLDTLSAAVEERMNRYGGGLSDKAVRRRTKRRNRMIAAFGITPETWHDFNWQIEHILRDANEIASLVQLSESERAVIATARDSGLPFGITPD